MTRTITVKGTGNVKVKPDQVELWFDLKAKDMDYDRAVEIAANQIDNLKNSLAQAKFNRDDIKTTSFDVSAVYDSVKDRYGNYERVFSGYVCLHRLKLSFDFDTARLSEAIQATVKSGVKPETDIRFTVKDPAAVNELILQKAAENARKKAEILCASSGVRLGILLGIDYNWGEIDFVSRTKYMLEDAVPPMTAACNLDIEPEDIDAGDTVTFVWEIE